MEISRPLNNLTSRECKNQGLSVVPARWPRNLNSVAGHRSLDVGGAKIHYQPRTDDLRPKTRQKTNDQRPTTEPRSAMHKPIKCVEKAVTIGAKGVWMIFERLNRIKPNPSPTP